MAKKKETVGQRVIGLLEREAIMYQYIDDLRATSKKLDRQHEDTIKLITENEARHEERMRLNEEGLRASREMQQALTILQGEAFQMIKELTSRTNDHDKRLEKAGM